MTHEQSSIATRQDGKGRAQDAFQKAAQGTLGSTGEGQGEAVAEEWRPVAGYEGKYEVSNRGRVKTLLKPSRTMSMDGVLNPRADKDGYLCVTLYGFSPSRGFRVSRLVATAFLGAAPSGFQVNHIDACKRNNAANNLEWTSNYNNIQHAIRLGLRKRPNSETWHASRLAERDVLDIRSRYSRGESQRVIAARYGVTQTNIHCIVANKSWAHI